MVKYLCPTVETIGRIEELTGSGVNGIWDDPRNGLVNPKFGLDYDSEGYETDKVTGVPDGLNYQQPC